jgi:hypothetical protein
MISVSLALDAVLVRQRRVEVEEQHGRRDGAV